LARIPCNSRTSGLPAGLSAGRHEWLLADDAGASSPAAGRWYAPRRRPVGRSPLRGGGPAGLGSWARGVKREALRPAGGRPAAAGEPRRRHQRGQGDFSPFQQVGRAPAPGRAATRSRASTSMKPADMAKVTGRTITAPRPGRVRGFGVPGGRPSATRWLFTLFLPCSGGSFPQRRSPYVVGTGPHPAAALFRGSLPTRPTRFITCPGTTTRTPQWLAGAHTRCGARPGCDCCRAPIPSARGPIAEIARRSRNRRPGIGVSTGGPADQFLTMPGPVARPGTHGSRTRAGLRPGPLPPARSAASGSPGPPGRGAAPRSPRPESRCPACPDGDFPSLQGAAPNGTGGGRSPRFL